MRNLWIFLILLTPVLLYGQPGKPAQAARADTVIATHIMKEGSHRVQTVNDTNSFDFTRHQFDTEILNYVAWTDSTTLLAHVKYLISIGAADSSTYVTLTRLTDSLAGYQRAGTYLGWADSTSFLAYVKALIGLKLSIADSTTFLAYIKYLDGLKAPLVSPWITGLAHFPTSYIAGLLLGYTTGEVFIFTDSTYNTDRSSTVQHGDTSAIQGFFDTNGDPIVRIASHLGVRDTMEVKSAARSAFVAKGDSGVSYLTPAGAALVYLPIADSLTYLTPSDANAAYLKNADSTTIKNGVAVTYLTKASFGDSAAAHSIGVATLTPGQTVRAGGEDSIYSSASDTVGLGAAQALKLDKAAVGDSVSARTNTSARAGVVATGSGQAWQVWKTDASGNPGWRTDSVSTVAGTVSTAIHDSLLTRDSTLTAVSDLSGLTGSDTTKWYVSNRGSDSNSGHSPRDPLLTLSALNGKILEAGDSVFLARGSMWREYLVFDESGSAGSPIVVTSYGSGAKPIINGSHITTGWTSYTANVYYHKCPSVPRIAVQNGTLLTLREFETDVATTFHTDSGAVAGSYSANEDTVFVWATDDADPDTHTMEIAYAGNSYSDTSSGIYANGLSYITLDGIDVCNTAYRGIWMKVATTAAGLTVKNCKVYNTGYIGLEIRGPEDETLLTDCLIDRDTVYNVRGHGIFYNYHVKGSTVSNCLVHDTGHDLWDPVTGWHGISAWGPDWTARVDSCFFEHNEVYGAKINALGIEGTGIQMDNKTCNSIVRFNKSHDNEGCGLFLNEGLGNSLQYNLVYRNNMAGVEVMDDTTAASIFNNVFYLNYENGLTAPNDHGAFAVKNNIFVNNASKASTYEVDIKNAVPADTVRNNLVYHSAGGNFLRWNWSAMAWTEWVDSSGDASGVNAYPVFMDSLNNDFRVEHTSGAIDAGVVVGLSSDFVAAHVPYNSTPDIGAHEYIGQALRMMTLAESGLIDSLATSDTLYLGFAVRAKTIGAIYVHSIGACEFTFLIEECDSLTQTAGLDTLMAATAVTNSRVTLSPTDSAWGAGKLLRLVFSDVTTEPKHFAVVVAGYE